VTEQEKREMWEQIKQKEPALAQLMLDAKRLNISFTVKVNFNQEEKS
jgi:hypothetical protein